MSVFFPALTAVLAATFAVAVIDQWRERRRAYQVVWAVGMVFFAVAAGAEAVAAATGWSEPVYRVWYLTGAVLTAGWLGLGNAFLLARTRFGFAFAACIFLAGLFTFLAARRLPDAGDLPVLYFVAAGVLALAVAIETYFGNTRWPYIAAGGVVAATVVGTLLAATVPLPSPGFAVDAATGAPTAAVVPPSLRLLTPFLNITGGLALILGALFSAYVFMPKRRVLPYSLDADQPGDSFLFNLAIAPVALTVNFIASLPSAFRALLTGRIHSRVPATMLIAVGAIVASSTDTLNRFGSTELFQVGKFVGVLLLFLGFLVSTEVFREIRVPFSGIVLRRRRDERVGAPAEDHGRG
jgi:hypothetical protein